MSYGEHPRGIAGWLLLFLLGMGAFGPLLLVFHLWREIGPGSALLTLKSLPGWPAFSAAAIVLCLVQIAIRWTVVFRLVKARNWNSVRIAVAGLWVSVLILVFGSAMALSLAFHVSFALILSAEGSELAQSVISAAIWTGYLLLSERVANTYPVISIGDVRDEAIA